MPLIPPMPPMPPWIIWYTAAVAFVFGCIWGSFFNVCIYRIPAGKSIVVPRSHCYSCGTILAWHDNIPLLSYVLLRGNCRYCGMHFSPRYFAVEMLTGLTFMGIFLQFGFMWAVIAHCIFAGFLIVGTFTDIDHFIIPDGITVGGFAYALLVALVLGRESLVADEYLLTRDLYTSFRSDISRYISEPGRLTVFAFALASAGFGWALLAGVGFLGRIMFRKEAMGAGDIKLFAFLGAYLGAINCIWVLFLSAILGSCIGLALILVHKLTRKDEYEEIELAGTRAAPALESAERDTIVVAQTVAPASSVLDEVATEPASPDAPITLRIARQTARQLHHFPFGPYIAVAAFLIMFFHETVNSLTREMLMLPQAYPQIEQLMEMIP